MDDTRFHIFITSIGVLPLISLITDLNVDAEVVKLLLRDAEETEGEAGVQAGDADPPRVRDVITGVSLPLPDIPRHLGGVWVQVQHLGMKDIIALVYIRA